MATASAQPLLWWTEKQLATLGELLAGPWTIWLREWYGLNPGEDGARCALAHEAPEVPASWLLLAGAGDSLAWSDVSGPVDHQVCTALFGAEATVSPTTLAAAMEKKAWDALQVELAMTMGLLRMPAEHMPEAADFDAWSGSVVVSLSSPVCSRRLLLNGACVSKALGAATGLDAGPAIRLAPVVDGISLLPVGASVELASCEIDVGSLQGVRVGDILRLPQALDEPMQLKVNGQLICAGYLGRRGIFRAVELLQIPDMPPRWMEIEA